jgi:uncharacterized membrane protein
MTQGVNVKTTRRIPYWAMLAVAWGVLMIVLQAPIGWAWIQDYHVSEYLFFFGLIPKNYLLNQMNPRFKSFKSDAEYRSALFRHLIAFAILISIPLILVFLDFNSRHGGIFFIADAIFTIFVTVVVVNSLSRRRDAVD